jgi:quercetin dioxygenase-like cupin family protein
VGNAGSTVWPTTGCSTNQGGSAVRHRLRTRCPKESLGEEATVPIQFFKQTIAVLAHGSDTNGVVGAVEVASPRGAVPPRHVHHREDEAFYVIEGAYSVFIGDDVIEATPGTWVWGPRGVAHGYQIHSERGRHLSLTMPAGFEGFFEEVATIATPSADPRNEMSRLTEVAARYGVELLGPPSAPT